MRRRHSSDRWFKARPRCGLFAVALVALNWHLSRTIQRPNTSTTWNVDGAGICLIVCVILLIPLAIRLYRLLRSLLDHQVRIPRDAKLVWWSDLICLLPLLARFSYAYSESASTPDGGFITTKRDYGYGSDLAEPLMAVAAVLILGYQAYSVLREYSRYDRDFGLLTRGHLQHVH